jgi:glutamate dehydrogenase/leucine dehydrogenase
VPDYVLNAGGLIHLVVREILRQRQVALWLAKINDTVHDVVTAALREHLPPLMVANRLALQKLG